MIYFNLNKELSVEKIINNINSMLRKHGDLNDTILVIKLQKISNYAGDSPIPKIEYKDTDSLS